MAWKVDKRIPEELFVQLLTKKANIIKDHLCLSINFLVKLYILFLSTTIQRKVYLYAFHLKQGGVIQPHN